MALRDPKVAYEHLTSNQLKALRKALEHDIAYNIKTNESMLFANTRMRIINDILEKRGAK